MTNQLFFFFFHYQFVLQDFCFSCLVKGSSLWLEQREFLDDENEQGTLKSQLLKKTTTWKHEFEDHQSQVEKLEDKLMEVKVEMKCTEDDSKELAYLWRGVKNHCNNASLPEIESENYGSYTFGLCVMWY